MNKIYSLEASKLYRLRNRRKLAEILDLPPTFFRKHHFFNYREFSLPKPNGDGVRNITDPEDELKHIQKKICKYLVRIETPNWIISGKKHNSYVSNAKMHVTRNYVKTMDISSFYDSANRSYIYKMFKDRFLMEADIAWILTDLVTYNGKLPTGSPSSQSVVFWAYRDMFEKINSIAESYDCIFSLYVDDMTFSSEKPIPKALRYEVSTELKKHGLEAKVRKDHYFQGNDFKIITGVGINNGELNVLNRHRKNILEQYRVCKKTKDSNAVIRLKGMLCAARQVEPEIFPEVANFIKNYERLNKEKTKN